MPGRIPPDLIERVRESTDLVELISGYVQLQRKGGNYFGLCPFHAEKTPSFSVHPGKGIFHCFGCGVGGNAFTFLQLHDKLSFAEAARELARRAGIAIPEPTGLAKAGTEQAEKFDALYRANELACQFFSRCLWEGKGEEFEQARDYLKQRDISPDLAKIFRLGYAPDRWDSLTPGVKKLTKEAARPPANRDVPDPRVFIEAGLMLQKDNRAYDRFRRRLMFPILNLSGKPIGFGGRILPLKGGSPKADEETAKYINSPQTPIYNKGSILYGLYQAREQIRRKGECLIVEGYTDLMRLHEGGFSNAVATSGTALTGEQTRLLRRFCKKVILIFDGDAAGSHAAVRGGDVLLAAGLDIRVVGLPPEYDPDTYLRSMGPSAFAEIVEKAVDAIAYRIELYRQEGRLRDAPARAEVAREILTSLAIIPDAIRKELAAEEAAQRIGLAKETLLRELARLKRSGRSPETEAPSTDPYARLPVKERGLLEALIRWPELRGAVFSTFGSREFQNPVMQRIAGKLEDRWLTKGDAAESYDNLIEDDTPIEDAGFISYALSQMEAEASPGIDRKLLRRHLDFRAAQDCLRDLLADQLRQSYQKLKNELVQIKDREFQRKLTQEIKETLDRQKTLRSKVFWNVPPHPSVQFSGVGPVRGASDTPRPSNTDDEQIHSFRSAPGKQP